MKDLKRIPVKLGSAYFISNDLFISWRLQPTKELDIYWANFIADHPELKASFEQAIVEFQALHSVDKTLYSNEESAVKTRLDASISRYKRRKTIFYSFSSVAAALLVLILSTVVISSLEREADEVVSIGDIAYNDVIELSFGDKILQIKDQSTIDFSSTTDKAVIKDSASHREFALSKKEYHRLVTPYGKRTSLILPDGSKVWLNSGTVIEFPSVFDDNERRIAIQGEIYIEVSHDSHKPFIVATPQSEVNVLGTTFNVSAYSDDVEESVVLVEGRVRVSSGTNSIILKPHQMSVVENHHIVAHPVDISEYTSWKDGYLVLRNASIEELLKKVSRYYNLEFKINKALKNANKTCSGKLFLSENIDDVLNAIATMTSFEYTQEQNTIIIN